MVEVLLWQDVPKLGKRGEVVKVADGYARNYLLPHRLATKATKQSLKELESYKKRVQREEERLKQRLLQIGRDIEKTSCTMEVKANEEGILFGSVTAEMIAEALNKQGWKEVTPAMITLEKPIKELGVYHFDIKLHQDITAHSRIWVVEESAGG